MIETMKRVIDNLKLGNMLMALEDDGDSRRKMSENQNKMLELVRMFINACEEFDPEKENKSSSED